MLSDSPLGEERAHDIDMTLYSVHSHQTWVAVRSQEEGRLWSFAVICLNVVPSLTVYRCLTIVLRRIRLETFSGLLLMVDF